MLTVKSTINIAGQTVPQIIPVVQGDTGRAVLFTLADFTIPQGSTATYYVQKPSGEAVYNAATIDGNTVLVELTAQSIIEAGDNYGQVRIENDGEIVTSFDFILLVKPFRGIDAVESTTEMNIFDKAVKQAEEAIDEAKVEALEEIAQAGSGNIAEEFDAANSYLAGEYTIYEAKLYRFTSNHTGLWTGSDAEEVTVGDELTDANEEITNLKSELTDDISILNSGGLRIPATFEHGNITDGVNSTGNYAVRTVQPLLIDKENYIRCDSGYRYSIAYYNGSGTFISQTALLTGITKIASGSNIRVVVRKLPDATLLDEDDPDIYAKHVMLYNDFRLTVDGIQSELTSDTDFITGTVKATDNLALSIINDVTMSTAGAIYTSSGSVVVWAKVFKGQTISFFSDNNGTMEATNCRYGFYNSVPVNGSTTSSYGSGYSVTVTQDCYIAFMRPSRLVYSATYENKESVMYKTDKMDTDIYGDDDTLTLSMMPNTAISNSNGTYFAQNGWTAGTTPVKAGYDLTFKADGVVTNCRYTIFDGAVNNNNIYSFGTGYGVTVPSDKSYNIMISTNATVTQFTISASKTGIKEKAEGAWSGKKIVWFGTSIPAGVVIAGGTSGVGSYPERLGKMLGATVYNEAVGSSRARGGSYKTASENDPLGWAGMSPLGILLSLSLSSTEKQGFIDNWTSKWSSIVSDPAGTMDNLTEAQITQYKNTSWDIKLAKYLSGGSVGQCDLYVFDHGFNDAVTTYQFNDMSDEPPTSDPTNRGYFLGAMGFLFKKILDDNPKAKILIIGHYMNQPTQGTTGQYLIKNGVDKCCAGQEKLASDWGIPIIKTWEYMRLSNNIISNNGTDMPVLFAYFPDGTHPASDSTGYALQYYADVLYPHIKGIA